ncbi:sugar ABC transporter permease [Stenotrophomonas maltophilia]|uniref:Transport permease protein n=1 Tax=Stenotrophomonas maltophilia TaxID=40324 RepID=A0A1A6XW57_STEMA|nr:ABC transporter permease [Stenotrophomonas maltophilia]OBU66945.1 sugar ABC transporter permease [Stenotrophomonas maltophilia]
MEPNSGSPIHLLRSLLSNRKLIRALAAREIAARYRGSLLGLAWALVQPIFMLAIYTFVFSEVFKARWPGGSGTRTEFALVLFSGLLVFNLFSEVFNRSPQLIVGNANYVKKVVFPLEILPVVSVLTAMFSLAVNLLVWFVFYIVSYGMPPVTALLLPLALLPMVLFMTGLAWLLSALGVFLRDTAQITAIITTAVMFLTPIFYPIDAIPPSFRPILNINPLAPVVAQIRDVLIWGKGLDPVVYPICLAVSALVFISGFAFFQKTRKGFADVL